MRLSPNIMRHPDVLIPLALIAGLLLTVLIIWIALKRRIAETQVEQERLSDQFDVLEGRMARIEGALYLRSVCDLGDGEGQETAP